MRLLIIGGTIFLGRHLVEAALARGHEVTLFNRGQHNPELFPQVEKIHGNRDGDLDRLNGRTWDAVIDTCGYVPRIARASAEKLADAAGHYTFISSISVYADFSRPGMDENAPLGALEDPATEEVTYETYGPLKVLCERAVEEAFPGRALNIRPGLIVGPHDPTDRFTCWPARVAQGGDVPVPGRPEQRIEFIDARDLAEWNIRLIEAGQAGVYNATGPDVPVTMQRLLEVSREVSGSDARFLWLSDAFLKEAGIEEPNAVLMWYTPENDAESQGAWEIDCRKALAAGLTYRPLDATVRDTLAWNATLPADRPYRSGWKPEQEQDILRRIAEA